MDDGASNDALPAQRDSVTCSSPPKKRRRKKGDKDDPAEQLRAHMEAIASALNDPKTRGFLEGLLKLSEDLAEAFKPIKPADVLPFPPERIVRRRRVRQPPPSMNHGERRLWTLRAVEDQP
ncbi:hypothetical protein CCP2SC5_240042 [Azospirillaceae bacterium]